MLKLIWNENLKIFSRKSSLLMLAALSLLTVFSSILTKRYSIFPGSLWDGMDNQYYLIFLVKIFALIIAGGIVADEFAWGTIKLLLIHPVSRSKILWSKYLTVILFCILLTVWLFLNSFVSNALLYGSQHPGGTFLNNAFAISTFSSVTLEHGLGIIEAVMYASLAFMLSVVSRSSALSIGLSLICMFVGPQITSYLRTFSLYKYILFANLNLSSYFDARVPIPHGMSLGWSLAVLGVYDSFLLVCSWWVFNKRDVS